MFKRNVREMAKELLRLLDYFQYGFNIRLISAESELVRSHTEKSCIATYFKQLSTDNKMKIIKLITVALIFT